MQVRTRPSLILLSGVMIGISIAIAHGVFAAKTSEGQAPLPLSELRTFVEILNRVKSDYVEPIEDEKLLENSIRGMLEGLDPHSAYLSADEFKEVTISTSGKFGGLGIEVQMQHGFVRVVAPIDDTPAARAGIQSGDLVMRIDDTAVKGLTLMDAVKLMRGEPGSKVTLTVLRESVEQPFKVDITRDIIKVRSVKSRMLDPGFGYVRITQFSSATGRALEKELDKLVEENKGALKGLVLDLRNNPGGVLNAAVEVSDAFLEKGSIVSIKGRLAETTQEFDATGGDLLKGKPIVVLVNGGSASASEIVAGALQDQERAVIMGTQTFGKGSVQTILPLQNSAALKLTTARYYTPSGRSIQAHGIEPDIEITPVKVSAAKDNGMKPLKEADLFGSLENENGDSNKKSEADGSEAADLSLAEKDYALYEALNLLKGLYIIDARN